MPKSYQTIQRICLDKDIAVSRWYCTDNIFNLFILGVVTEKDIADIKALFPTSDYLSTYNCFAIDMDLEPGDDSYSDHAAKNFKEPKRKHNIDFNL